MSKFKSTLILSQFLTIAVATQVSAQILNDPLQGSTIGTRSGGSFVTGGWQVTDHYNWIYWHVATTNHGAFEYNVKGLPPTNCPGNATGLKNEISHIYDFTWNNADNQYAPGYRDDPYKEYQRRNCESPKENKMENLWTDNGPQFFEDDTATFSWQSGANYKFRIEWINSGGNAIKYTFRNDALVWSQTLPGSWSPAGQSVRIAASPRQADEGASTGAIYSNVKVFDLNAYTPPTPAISVPANAATVKDQVTYIQWTGELHTGYQVRCNTANDPNTGIAWDSQQVTSGRYFTWTGTLSNNTTYYVFVRTANGGNWSGWSANGRTFTVNTGFVPSGTDYVTVKGNSYANFGGPFVGLGFTYMRSLYNCKYQRTRYQNDLAYMASKKYNYQRMLTMVPWCGLEIAPVTYTSGCGGTITGWSDYWQQFRDDIDVAYSYGIMSEITIFAGGQDIMPNDSTKMAHIDNILANLVGREHKVALIEVANEHYQNGFPDPWGIADVAAKAQYISDRTPIPVAMSATSDESDFGITSGASDPNAADIAVVHFSRDIGTAEGGWLPVRDSWRLGPVGTLPMSSNEPIGAGSSVSTENDPIKLCMAGVFAWTASCVSYVYHSRAGTFGWELCCPPGGQEKFFDASPGSDSYQFMQPLVPKDLSSWARSDGKDGASPFTNWSGGQADKWWPEVGGAGDGCSRNIASIKAGRFVTCPIGILGGGLTLTARRPMHFKAYNPLSGSVAYDLTKNANDTFTLAQGQQAYVIIGDFTDLPLDGGGSGTGTQVNIDLGTTDLANGMTHPQPSDGDTVAANIGGRDCKKNVTAGADNYFYFAVSDGYAFQGNKPNHWIRFDYYDTGTGTATLEYDSASAAYTNGGTITYTNSNTWKTALFNVVDAYFGNRQNSGADFRLSRSVTFYLDTVYVYAKAFSGTSIVLPATVQAEDFNNGGPGQGYSDSDATNNGGQYRNEQVDIEVTSDTGGGYNVGWITAGEYLNYQINVTTAGNYDFAVRGATPNAGVTYHIEISGVNVSGTQTFPNTGGWQTWTTQTISNIALTTGVKTMKISMDNGGWNFNYVTITGHQGPFGGSARAIPGVIQTEDFDDGGAEVAYHDADATNNGGQYRTTEQVDIEACTDTGGGYNIGWTDAGDWLEYTVNVNTTGDYAVKMRVASGSCCGGSFNMSVDGGSIFGTRAMASTGGWQTWTTIVVPGIFLTAGNNKILRLSIDAGGFNINYMDFAFIGADIVSVDMDTNDINDGMTRVDVGDGNTTATSIGGHNCRQNTDPGAGQDFYMYFAVPDIYAFQGNKNNAAITLEYYDNGTGAFDLNYDSTTNPYAYGGSVARTNTNTWKTFTFNVTDAYFGNRQNGGADFRFWGAATTFYFDTVIDFSSAGVAPPGQASNPNPANGATLVDKNADLSWTAGSGATNRDVRFGTVNPPPFVINQTATTYDPGTMAVNTLYYWRIDEKNTGGTTTGVVWSFTTLPVPGAASSPSPANGATLVAITTALTWTAGSNAASHNVNFGTVNPPPFIQNQAGTSYNPSKSPNTLYYWRIDEVNTSGTTTGTVWSFTTLPVPGAASAPNPANGATGVSVTPTLTWTAGSNASSHDVRFGTANPPPFVQNQAGTSYAPGTLTGTTTYFWRIDEVNSSGTTTGSVWSFTTAVSIPTYIQNSSFEGGFGAAGGGFNGNKGNTWTAFLYGGVNSDLTFADETGAGNFDTGAHSQKITAAAGKEGGVYNQFSVTNGNNYTVTVRVKSGSPAGWAFLGINTSGGTNPLSGTIYPVNNNRSTSWTTLSWTGTATGSLITVFLDVYDGVAYWDTATPGNNPPALATSPNPASGATGVSVTPTLTWTAGSGATSHDVRFGTANPPPFIQNQAGTSYAPGTLSASTTYFWRIDEKNTNGTTTGTVWSFTTSGGPPPNAPTVTAPSNGATVTSLTPTITWTGDAHDQYQVRISQVNDSNTSTNGWDSGTVTSSGSSAVSGTLRNYSLYFVFVRLHNANGFGAWSAAGYTFIVNTNSVIGTVYLGNSLPSSNGWVLYGSQSWENDGVDIVSSFISDGGSTVWRIADNATNKRSNLKYNPSGFDISFNTGCTVASRMRTTGVTGTPTYNLGIVNGGVGGLFVRLEASQVRLVDLTGSVKGTFALDGTVYHKYQLSVKNTTNGNNATAAWKLYVDGTQQITFTGAGTQDGADSFLMGNESLNATGTWYFDWSAGRSDGEFSPAQWDPLN